MRQLPLLERHFRRLASFFDIHHHVRRVIEREKTYLSTAFSPGPWVPQSPPPGAKRPYLLLCLKSRSSPLTVYFLFVSKGEQRGKIVYTGLFKSMVDDKVKPIAFTSTSSSTIGPDSAEPELATCGMMLGCTDDDMHRLRRMLQDTPRTWRNHPILLPLIFIELQSKRLCNLVSKATAAAVLISVDDKMTGESSSDNLPHGLIKEAMKVRSRSLIIQEDLSRASRQLANIISHCECLLDRSSALSRLLKKTDIDGSITQTFLCRLKEVDTDYQDLIADCKINYNEASRYLDLASSPSEVSCF